MADAEGPGPEDPRGPEDPDTTERHATPAGPSGPRATRPPTGPPSSISTGIIPLGLLLALSVQAAVPPFATDMYTPAFPAITVDLSTTATMIGLTLASFFIGMGAGQIVGGAASDQLGRRGPILVGALVSMAGSLMCMVAPSVPLLIVGRLLQGLGGGAAGAVARAVVVDLAHGDVLARTMSLMMAITGLAPMIAPIAGGLVITYTTWRVVFLVLACFGLVMIASAWFVIPESLPSTSRHRGGMSRFVSGIGSVLHLRIFVAYMFTSAFSAFCMFAYVSNSSFLLQDQKGLSPLANSLVFAMNASGQVVFTLVNSRLVGWMRPRRLMAVGLGLSAVAVAIVTVCVLALGTPLVPTVIGFFLLMSGQAFIFGNSSSLALGAAREHAGTASAVMGLVQSTIMGISAPLASSGGATSSVPMVVVMLIGVLGAWATYLLAGWLTRRDGGAPRVPSV